MNPEPQNRDIKEFRSFGLIFGFVFVVIGVWPMVRNRLEPRLWALIVSGIFVSLALLWPIILKPFHRAWMKFGQGLAWVNTRIILSFMFYFVFAPMHLVFVLVRRDPMHRRMDSLTKTYKVPKSPRSEKHMERQF